MNTELFDQLRNGSGTDFRDAYLVIKNQYSRHPDNTELFCTFIDYTLEISGYDMEFDARKTYLEEAYAALTIFSESADISADILALIKEKNGDVAKARARIELDEKAFYEKKQEQVRAENAQILKKLTDLCQSIKGIQTQEQFDQILTDISQAEEKLIQDLLTPKQNEAYRKLSKYCSDSISQKMEELNYQNLLSINMKAAESFKKVMDTYSADPSRFNSNTGNLRNLVVTQLFSYDTKDLFNETLIYYNHVYSYIFNQVDEQLKFRLTEWSLEAKKSR